MPACEPALIRLLQPDPGSSTLAWSLLRGISGSFDACSHTVIRYPKYCPRNGFTGFDSCAEMSIVYRNGKSLDAARSNEAAGENAVATFACRIMLNMNGLRGREHET
jgi:hypothetical protein